MGFLSNLNPINAIKAVPKVADKVVDTVKDAGSAAVDTAKDAGGAVVDAVQDEFKDLKTNASNLGLDALAMGRRLVTGGNGLIFASPLDAKRRAELMAAATDPANADKIVAGDSTRALQNKHRTNTPEEMLEGLKGDYSCFEGDVRIERGLFGHGDTKAIMAHDAHGTDGMTLKDWMTIGAASGRKLKLDFKEAAALDESLKLAKELKIPGDRLIFNGGLNLDYPAIRKDFPDATLAINPPGDADKGVPYGQDAINQTIASAKEHGQPVIFPLRSDRVTPEVVAALKPYGEVAIWNAPSKDAPADVPAAVAKFRAMGVDGMIDISGKGH